MKFCGSEFLFDSRSKMSDEIKRNKERERERGKKRKDDGRRWRRPRGKKK